jgi:hypothetical protein
MLAGARLTVVAALAGADSKSRRPDMAVMGGIAIKTAVDFVMTQPAEAAP